MAGQMDAGRRRTARSEDAAEKAGAADFPDAMAMSTQGAAPIGETDHRRDASDTDDASAYEGTGLTEDGGLGAEVSEPATGEDPSYFEGIDVEGEAGPRPSRTGITGKAPEKAREVAQQARERVSEYAQQAQEKVSEYARTAQQQAERGKEFAAEGMHKVAKQLRQRAGSDGGGMTAATGGKVAEGMERTAGYLREHDTAQIWGGIESYVRKHPAQALAGAVFAGFLIGRMIR